MNEKETMRDYVFTDPYNTFAKVLKLTPSQVRFFEWAQELGYFASDISLIEVSDQVETI